MSVKKNITKPDVEAEIERSYFRTGAKRRFDNALGGILDVMKYLKDMNALNATLESRFEDIHIAARSISEELVKIEVANTEDLLLQAASKRQEAMATPRQEIEDESNNAMIANDPVAEEADLDAGDNTDQDHEAPVSAVNDGNQEMIAADPRISELSSKKPRGVKRVRNKKEDNKSRRGQYKRKAKGKADKNATPDKEDIRKVYKFMFEDFKGQKLSIGEFATVCASHVLLPGAFDHELYDQDYAKKLSVSRRMARRTKVSGILRNLLRSWVGVPIDGIDVELIESGGTGKSFVRFFKAS